MLQKIIATSEMDGIRAKVKPRVQFLEPPTERQEPSSGEVRKIKELDKYLATLVCRHAQGICRVANLDEINRIYRESREKYMPGSYMYCSRIKLCVITLLGLAFYGVPERQISEIDLVNDAIKKTEWACDMNSVFGKKLLAKCYIKYTNCLTGLEEEERRTLYKKAYELDPTEDRYGVY